MSALRVRPADIGHSLREDDIRDVPGLDECERLRVVGHLADLRFYARARPSECELRK